MQNRFSSEVRPQNTLEIQTLRFLKIFGLFKIWWKFVFLFAFVKPTLDLDKVLYNQMGRLLQMFVKIQISPRQES